MPEQNGIIHKACGEELRPRNVAFLASRHIAFINLRSSAETKPLAKYGRIAFD
jgi:hypothetical protein